MNYKLFKFKMKVRFLKYKKDFLSMFEYEKERNLGEEIFEFENRDGTLIPIKSNRSFKNLLLNIRDYFFMIKVDKLTITEYGMFFHKGKHIAFKNMFVKFGNWFF